MSTDDFNKLIKPLADKWADDMIKDGLVNEDGTIPITVNTEDIKYTITAHDVLTYYIAFNNKVNKEVGKLDFEGDKLVFEGNVEESAEVFIDYLLKVFNQKIEDIKTEAWNDGYDEGNSA